MRVECPCNLMQRFTKNRPEFWIEVLSMPTLQDLEGTELLSSNDPSDMQFALEGLMKLFTGQDIFYEREAR